MYLKLSTVSKSVEDIIALQKVNIYIVDKTGTAVGVGTKFTFTTILGVRNQSDVVLQKEFDTRCANDLPSNFTDLKVVLFSEFDAVLP